MTQTTVKETSALEGLVKSFASYNRWANTTLVNWLKQKPAELMDKEVASSFPSICLTLIHIWDTERFWLSVLKREPAPPSFRMVGFDGSLEEVYEGIVKHSEQLETYIHSLSDEEVQERVAFYSPWAEGNEPRFEYLLQVLNHSTYHRGQVVTIGRNVGLTDAPMTDYNFYLLYGRS
ncbi:DinB family protein [Ohtaekwangia koreensis]|uniref:Uncharacterized damage-inducible protein DinB (Forms a four-helix bundle) n=1 Tax=Ohtaekwangia koreensis TaxID=688867 RepID=A0A1T5IVK3_9BACT|nr:DinB family protein [Ohtaekwangia koreensis]SKC43226.1 Uncharacterized damage-inducible protein DinB (forms a four-helix bundle) [Ohtaekwangia koreensis]